MIETTWPIRHNIKVEPDIADIDLDWDFIDNTTFKKI